MTTIWEHAVALLAGVVIPLAGGVAGAAFRRGGGAPERLGSAEKVGLYWANSAFLALLACGAVAAWWHAGRGLGALGLRVELERPILGAALGVAVAALYAIDLVRQLSPERLERTRARWRRDLFFLPEDRREAAHALVLVLGAALFEEVVYRGFLIAYAARFTGDTPLGVAAAIALPALAFALAHAWQGARAMAKVGLLALLFGALLALTGSLWIPIALHLAIDLTAVLLAPRLLARAPGEGG